MNLVATPNGLQLKPIADQIPPEQQLQEDALLEAVDEQLVSPLDAANSIHVIGASFDAADPAAETIPLNRLQEVAATMAKQARDLRLPSCMWIHLPQNQLNQPVAPAPDIGRGLFDAVGRPASQAASTGTSWALPGWCCTRKASIQS